MTIRRILFPTDFSSRDRLAEEYVRRLAAHFGSHVTVLHVIDQSTPYQYHGQTCDETSDAKKLHEHVDAQLAEVLPGLAADRAVMFGDVAAGIAECAEESGADLIMIPLHVRARVQRIYGDSVAVSVLNDNRWRVWSTSHDSEEPGHEHFALKKMVWIVSPESAEVIPSAADFAMSFHAALSAGYVEVDPHGPVERVCRLFATRAREHDADELEIGRIVSGIRRESGMPMELLVESGVPSQAIARIARRADADLIIMGRAEAGRLSPPLHHALYSIVRDAPCPVMVL